MERLFTANKLMEMLWVLEAPCCHPADGSALAGRFNPSQLIIISLHSRNVFMGAVDQYHHGFYRIAFPPRSTPPSVRPSLTLYVIHVIHTVVVLCRTGENLIGLLNLIMPTAFVVCRPVSRVS